MINGNDNDDDHNDDDDDQEDYKDDNDDNNDDDDAWRNCRSLNLYFQFTLSIPHARMSMSHIYSIFDLTI